MLLFAELICRIFFLLSRGGCLCIWTVWVGCFVNFSSLEWSNYNSREDRFQPTERPAIDLHTQDYGTAPPPGLLVSTYDIQPKHDLCVDTIWGDSGYLGILFIFIFRQFFIPSVLQKL